MTPCVWPQTMENMKKSKKYEKSKNCQNLIFAIFSKIEKRNEILQTTEKNMKNAKNGKSGGVGAYLLVSRQIGQRCSRLRARKITCWLCSWMICLCFSYTGCTALGQRNRGRQGEGLAFAMCAFYMLYSLVFVLYLEQYKNCTAYNKKVSRLRLR